LVAVSLCKVPPVIGVVVVSPALELELELDPEAALELDPELEAELDRELEAELELELGVPVALPVTTADGTTYVVARLMMGFATTVSVVGLLQVTFPSGVAPQQCHVFVLGLNVISRFFRFEQAVLQWGSEREESVQPPR